MMSTPRLSEPVRAVLVSLLRQAGRPVSLAELVTLLREKASEGER